MKKKNIEIHHREENDDDLPHDEDDDHLWAVEGARVLALTACILTSRHPEPNQIKIKIKLPP